jgi:hypothetical protein
MVDAKVTSDTEFLSWFRPRRPYVQQWVLEALYYLAPGVPVVGLLQARRERKRGFQVPGGVAEDIVGELENECVVCGVFLSRMLLGLSPCGWGLHARRAI